MHCMYSAENTPNLPAISNNLDHRNMSGDLLVRSL